MFIDGCYFRVAEKLGDVMVCEKIRDKFRTGPYPLCIATVTRSSAICDTLDEYSRPLCYKTAAVAKNDILICNKISTELEIEDCYGYMAGSTKDPSICRTMSFADNSQRDICYYRVVEATLDYKLCTNIANPNIKLNCQNKSTSSSF